MRPEDEPDAKAAARPRVVRLAWLAAGWVLFGVGVVGVVVPGLPTTGPMLLALGCFARGSERMRDWLWNHPRFGPPLREWSEHRTMPLRAKVTAVAMMVASFVGIVAFSAMPAWGKGAVGVFIGVGLVVVLRIPHTRREDLRSGPPGRSHGP